MTQIINEAKEVCEDVAEAIEAEEALKEVRKVAEICDKIVDGEITNDDSDLADVFAGITENCTSLLTFLDDNGISRPDTVSFLS